MQIQKKSIRSIAPVVAALEGKDSVVVSYTMPCELSAPFLCRIGFEPGCGAKASIIPRAIGPVSRFNSCGKDRVLRHLPKESYSRWGCIKDWHDAVHFVDIPGERYQREHLPAPMEELALIARQGEWRVLSRAVPKRAENHPALLHLINLFLELFGECDILDEQLMPLIDARQMKRVYWEILPPGELPWEAVEILAEGVCTKGVLRRAFQRHRYDCIRRFRPDAVYRGVGGLGGYLVFEFRRKGISLMENFTNGNATYICHGDWKEVSQRTKAEIIRHSLCERRIVHSRAWPREMAELLR